MTRYVMGFGWAVRDTVISFSREKERFSKKVFVVDFRKGNSFIRGSRLKWVKTLEKETHSFCLDRADPKRLAT